jgi:Spy/CpxP family protein refolding chaperone
LKKTAIFVLVLALLIGASVVYSQGPTGQRQGARQGAGGMGGFGMSCPAMAIMPPSAMMLERMDTLQLTDEQKTNLQTIAEKSDQTLLPLRQKAQQAAQALRTAVVSASYDEVKVAKLVADAQKAEAAVITAELQVWSQVRPVLTPEQLTALQTMGGGFGGFRQGQGQGGRRSGNYGGTPPAGAPGTAAPESN